MQLITGLIGMFCLCILGSAFITGGEGLLFVNPYGILFRKCWLLFWWMPVLMVPSLLFWKILGDDLINRLISLWYLLVGFFFIFVKLFSLMNSSVLLMYSFLFISTRPLPLSAFMWIMLLFFNFLFTFCTVFSFWLEY